MRQDWPLIGDTHFAPFEVETFCGGVSWHGKVIGVDEVGRGPLAGPVVAGAVCFQRDDFPWLAELTDSKKMSDKKREQLYPQITQSEGIVWGIGVVDAAEIDEINILQASFKAMRKAIAQLKVQPSWVLVDGHLPISELKCPQYPLKKGDARSLSIAGASVIAKVWRDRFMVTVDQKYPQYGFAKHKGYPTQQHRDAITKYGPCELHRSSFRGAQ